MRKVEERERTNSWAAAAFSLCFQFVTEPNQEQRAGPVRHDAPNPDYTRIEPPLLL
jgi:hypothetical protein